MKTRNAILLMVFVLTIAITAVAQNRWVPGANGRIRGKTLIGGSEPGRSRLFLCAGYMNGTYHPGKLVGRNCNFGYGGREISRNRYYTLNVSNSMIRRYRWMRASYGRLPRARGFVPISVGREGRRTLYVCRARYRGGVHPGKVVGQNCNFGYGGREITMPNYQVLMFNTSRGRRTGYRRRRRY